MYKRREARELDAPLLGERDIRELDAALLGDREVLEAAFLADREAADALLADAEPAPETPLVRVARGAELAWAAAASCSAFW